MTLPGHLAHGSLCQESSWKYSCNPNHAENYLSWLYGSNLFFFLMYRGIFPLSHTLVISGHSRMLLQRKQWKSLVHCTGILLHNTLVSDHIICAVSLCHMHVCTLYWPIIYDQSFLMITIAGHHDISEQCHNYTGHFVLVYSLPYQDCWTHPIQLHHIQWRNSKLQLLFIQCLLIACIFLHFITTPIPCFWPGHDYWQCHFLYKC